MFWHGCLLACLASQAAAPAMGDPVIVALVENEYASVDDFQTRLTQLEHVLESRGDHRAVFAAMYVIITAMATDAIADGYFDDPSWTEAFVVHFGNLYRKAFLDFESGNTTHLAEAWRVAFETAAGDEATVFQHAILGVHAHINHDIPFALAAITAHGDRSRRLHDYLLTNQFLVSTIDEVEDAVSQFDPSLGKLDASLGRNDEHLLRAVLTQWRMTAWQRSALLDGSQSPRVEAFYAALLDRVTGRSARQLSGDSGPLVDIPPLFKGALNSGKALSIGPRSGYNQFTVDQMLHAAGPPQRGCRGLMGECANTFRAINRGR